MNLKIFSPNVGLERNPSLYEHFYFLRWISDLTSFPCLEKDFLVFLVKVVFDFSKF